MILVAAEKLFKELGFNETTLNDIAAQTGDLVSRHTISRLFSSKEHILTAIYVKKPQYVLDMLDFVEGSTLNQLQTARLALDILQHAPGVFDMARAYQEEIALFEDLGVANTQEEVQSNKPTQ